MPINIDVKNNGPGRGQKITATNDVNGRSSSVLYYKDKDKLEDLPAKIKAKAQAEDSVKTAEDSEKTPILDALAGCTAKDLGLE